MFRRGCDSVMAEHLVLGGLAGLLTVSAVGAVLMRRRFSDPVNPPPQVDTPLSSFADLLEAQLEREAPNHPCHFHEDVRADAWDPVGQVFVCVHCKTILDDAAGDIEILEIINHLDRWQEGR